MFMHSHTLFCEKQNLLSAPVGNVLAPQKALFLKAANMTRQRILRHKKLVLERSHRLPVWTCSFYFKQNLIPNRITDAAGPESFRNPGVKFPVRPHKAEPDPVECNTLVLVSKEERVIREFFALAHARTRFSVWWLSYQCASAVYSYLRKLFGPSQLTRQRSKPRLVAKGI